MTSPSRRRQVFRVLLVERDQHALDELRELLDGRRFEAEVALSVETGEEILAERRMDAVIVNGAMDAFPRGGVPALIRRLKEMDGGMKVVIFNGVARKSAQRRMRRLGADGYLGKGGDLKDVQRSVFRVLGLDGG